MVIENLAWTAVKTIGAIPERSSHGMAGNGKDFVIVFGGNTTDDQGVACVVRGVGSRRQASRCR